MDDCAQPNPQQRDEPIALRGVTWNHPRGVDSIKRASAEFTKLNPNVTLEWVARPLHEFEDLPLDILAAEFDIMAIDHPFVGDGAEKGALAPLSSLVSARELQARSDSYVGSSFASYGWNGDQYALPIDAACMVSAIRSDIESKAKAPETWDEVFEAARTLGRDRVLLTANHTHLWGTFLSLCEAHSPGVQTDFVEGPSWWTPEGIVEDAAIPTLELLREFSALAAQRSFSMDPVQVLDEMSGGGPGVYCPSVFIYSTYAHERAERARLSFHDAPRLGPAQVGTLAGGVGLGIARRSPHAAVAAEFALFATSEDLQKGAYSEAGGQPATISAWADETVNARAGDLYRQTTATMERSFIRPRRKGYPDYQRSAAHLLHDRFLEGAQPMDILRDLNRMWADVVAS
ncbi:extracellular solute-binding protein [Microbacterium resistens]|uniref:ABC transporter substrate-binding protein n=1 Tax=Microbacterium resistens TaxID=156977 RepID=UPI001C5648B5|nr:extracellular solute-binding protein [Microbacterium resistens]MBW1638473.1 extracellular solute-binding protein [Microbacterium resistens]